MRARVFDADVDDFVSHTSNLLTSLQAKMSMILVSGTRGVSNHFQADYETQQQHPGKHKLDRTALYGLTAAPLAENQKLQQQATHPQLLPAQTSLAAGRVGEVHQTAAIKTSQQQIDSCIQATSLISEGVQCSDILSEINLPAYSQRFTEMRNQNNSIHTQCTNKTGHGPKGNTQVSGNISIAKDSRLALAFDRIVEMPTSVSLQNAAGSENAPPQPRPLPACLSWERTNMNAMPFCHKMNASSSPESSEFSWRPCNSA